MTCKSSGIAASQRLGIVDQAEAWNMDNAVTFRLLRFDNERQERQAKLIAFEVSKIFSDGRESDPDETVEYV